MADGCAICDRVALTRAGENPFLIHEFPHSFFVVGDQQFHRGYSLLLFKRHVRELHELTPAEQAGLSAELMTATSALVETFSPWKMNHACLGNQDEHVHWHLMPRHQSDPDHRTQPWKNSGLWHSEPVLKPDEAATLAEKIRKNLRISV